MRGIAGIGFTRGAAGKVLALLLVVAVVTVIVAGLSACGGGSSVAGAYAVESGTEEGMEGFTLTLADDDTFSLAQDEATEGMEPLTITGTYTLDGDKITLKTEGEGAESEVGTVEGDKLVFETITWVKK